MNNENTPTGEQVQYKRIEKQIVKHLKRVDKVLALLSGPEDDEIDYEMLRTTVAVLGLQNVRVLGAFLDEDIVSMEELADALKAINKSSAIKVKKIKD